MTLNEGVIMAARILGKSMEVNKPDSSRFEIGVLTLDSASKKATSRRVEGAELDKILADAKVFENLADACKDLNEVLATSARERYKYKDVMDPKTGCDTIVQSCANGFKVGILFGGERAGLSNEDLFLAKKLIRVPTNPVFSSLNLAQSVLLISYQLNVCSIKQNKESSQTSVSVTKANYQEMQAFATRLENELDKNKFFYPEGKKKRMKTRLRKLIYGLELSKEDVKIFHGVLKSLIKRK